MPILANELIDTVIDFLHEDRSSLRACALVSKSCLPSARYHLFSVIAINASNFPSFLRLIESASHIGPLVRGLQVFDQCTAGEGSEFMAQNMSRIAPSLQNVIFLKIKFHGWDFRNLETLEQSLVHAFGTKIRHLQLHSQTFRSFSHATDFICHFSNLRHLETFWIWWSLDNDPYTVRRLRTLEPLTVHTGEIAEGKVILLLAWLHIQHPPPKVISATFCVSDLIPHNAIPSTFGKTLQTLYLSKIRRRLRVFPKLYGLGHCTNLKSIHFGGILLWSRYRPGKHKWVPYTLAQVKSRVVTELVFTLQLEEVSHLEYFDWLGVIDIIRHSQFDQLRRVCVVLDCGDDIYPKVSRMVRENEFRAISDRGILFVEKFSGRRGDY